MTTVQTAQETAEATAEPTVRRPRAAPVLAAGLLATGCTVLAIVDPSHGPTICPFKLATGLDCPGCGGTRAVHQLLNGHLLAALDYNVLAVLAFPLILWGLFVSITKALGGPRYRTYTPSNRTVAIAVVVLIAFWVTRNLPMEPFHWLYSGS